GPARYGNGGGRARERETANRPRASAPLGRRAQRVVRRRPLGDRCGEHVAAARDRADRLLRLVVERATDLDEALRERVVGDDDVRPDGADQLVLGHELAVALDEVGQDLERLGSQLDLRAVAAQEAAVEVKREVAEAIPRAAADRRDWRRRAHDTPPKAATYASTASCRNHERISALSSPRHDSREGRP